jgi:hypothetical protein
MGSSERRVRAKTETLSLRLDPKIRFALEFVSRVRGQSITTVVERAINETANQVVLGPPRSSFYEEYVSREECPTWHKFWDPSEGVRTLKLLSNSYYPSTSEEDELRAFTYAHIPFFYGEDGQTFDPYIAVLWPRINEFLSIWRATQSSDFWATGRAMAEALRKAKVSAPDWPPNSKQQR